MAKYYEGNTKYQEANKLNLTKFMDHTRPIYWLYHCYFGLYDCSDDWVHVRTIHGNPQLQLGCPGRKNRKIGITCEV